MKELSSLGLKMLEVRILPGQYAQRRSLLPVRVSVGIHLSKAAVKHLMYGGLINSGFGDVCGGENEILFFIKATSENDLFACLAGRCTPILEYRSQRQGGAQLCTCS